MPQITIDKRTLDKVNKKQGVYNSLGKQTIMIESNLREVAGILGKFVTEIVEKSFRQYCKAHKADKETTEREWKRFNKFLQRNL